VIDVPDEEILEAKAAIDASGVGCEPASAASVAGARRLVRDGVIQPRDRVVAVLTGHILKDPDILLGQSPGTEIDARIEEVARVARGAWRGARGAEIFEGVSGSPLAELFTPPSFSRAARRAVTVPGSTSNLGAGFDCVGVAIDRRLTVSLSLGGEPGRVSVRREGTAAALSCAPEEDLVYRGFAAACEARGRAVPDGLELSVTSDIPIARGLGSSAAAVVAGASLANSALELGLDREEIAVLCASLEGHPDNAGPAAFGGAVLVVPRRDADASQRYIFAPITMHVDLGLAFAVPDFELTTTAARAVLPSSLSHASAVEAAAKSAALVRGLETGDAALLAAAFDDVLHVPHRRALVNGYDAVVTAALTAGAYGATLSGSGPTIVAIGSRAIMPRIANAMKAQWAELGVAVETIY
ncbi:MAG TPA: homoserine kinase, partial [Gemmatimonadaceae bacterium]|nr:homoserine kinase [Gemmatimonadaceae bacterium]